MGRRRNRYLGKWRETRAAAIELPFTVENVALLLADGVSESGSFTHQQIAAWAERYSLYHMRIWDEAVLEGIGEEPDARGMDVVEDIHVQWGLYLFNTYSLEELQRLDFASVELPRSWFREWLDRLRDAV